MLFDQFRIKRERNFSLFCLCLSAQKTAVLPLREILVDLKEADRPNVEVLLIPLVQDLSTWKPENIERGQHDYFINFLDQVLFDNFQFSLQVSSILIFHIILQEDFSIILFS